jgi:hypothetical protein
MTKLNKSFTVSFQNVGNLTFIVRISSIAITKASVNDFFDLMECYQLADQLDPVLKQQNQSKTNKDDNKKLMEKLNDKKRKAQPKKDDSNVPALKKSCLINGPDSSHTTDECQTMREQAYRMKDAYKNIFPAE